MEPKKKKAKTKEKCQDCVNIEQHPLWGHTLCSYHRECSGNDDWQPEFCTKCRRQKKIYIYIYIYIFNYCMVKFSHVATLVELSNEN